jgi:alcohol dehydrogenase class IV
MVKHIQRFNFRSCPEIRREADEAFRNASSEDSLIEYLAAVKHKLGSVKNSTQAGWRSDRFMNGATSPLQKFGVN